MDEKALYLQISHRILQSVSMLVQLPLYVECREFDAEECPTSEIKPVIVQWETRDGNESAPSFDFVQEMPHVYAECWIVS